MDEHFLSFDFIYYTIGLEMHFQIRGYIYPRQFRRGVPSFSKAIQAVAEFFEFFEHVISSFCGIMFQNIFVDSENIGLGLVNYRHAVDHFNSLI